MYKIEGLVNNVIKSKEFDGVKYIKVTNILNGDVISPQGRIIINTVLYRESESGYEPVSPLEVPLEHRTKLSYSHSYKTMDNNEILNFSNKLSKQNLKIKDNANFIKFEKLDVGTVCNINYVLCKEKDVTMYNLVGIIAKPDGTIKKQYVLNTNELPYVIIDIVSKEPTLDNRTMVIAPNTFAHIHKEGNVIILVIAYLDDTNERVEGDTKVLSLKCAGTYPISNENNIFTFITDKESEVLYDFKKEDKMMTILNEIKTNIGVEDIK